MITIEMLVSEISGLQRDDLERWIVNQWVKPDGSAGRYRFHDIDVARVRLIAELRDEMEVTEAALPIVLSLLDQLYDQRRRLRELSEAILATASSEMRATLFRYLANPSPR